tara:strand:+ start:1577 stop:2686 length:1110 start_codon:yes stop_codon:yes gene_type:complete
MLTQSGVLNKKDLIHLISEGIISGPSTEKLEGRVDATTFDHSLGERGHYLGKSILPQSKPMTQMIKERKQYDLEGDKFHLHRGQAYLFPLAEKLDLFEGLSGKSSSKSSIGRLGVVTRLITEKGRVFNEIPEGYTGKLYLELYSLKFDIVVGPGLSLNQTRFSYGLSSLLPEHLVRSSHQGKGLLFLDGKKSKESEIKGSGILMTADIETGGILVAKNDTNEPLDLTRDFSNPDNLYKTEDFFDRVYPDRMSEVVLRPGEFYNILSREGSIVPLEYAGGVRKFDEAIGEISSHEASYVHAGWGMNRSDGVKGTPLILEVTANKFPITIKDESALAFLDYSTLTSPLTPEEAYDKKYNHQGLTAGKIFKD